MPVLLLAVTTIYLVNALQMMPPIKRGDITASFFPVVLAVIMYLSIGVVLWQGRSEAGKGAAPETPPAAGAEASVPALNRFGALWVTLVTGLYIGVFSVIGYSLSTFLYVLLLTFLFGNPRPGKGGRAWIVKIAAALVITLLGYALFELIFQVRLPTLWT
ncbi:tripartite tricarboxylate transporter TctB family protein [Billgrantia saliphila]|uniref:tripartite tricarboxylate transporter TctB family protein n=1 Tax=Billgrantia saliphila TaxID=1848458 RepID=UPI0018CC7576|nr:tripartite tricarboxylate transporter TctB family protein [Halomonas saliphila]